MILDASEMSKSVRELHAMQILSDDLAGKALAYLDGDDESPPEEIVEALQTAALNVVANGVKQ